MAPSLLPACFGLAHDLESSGRWSIPLQHRPCPTRNWRGCLSTRSARRCRSCGLDVEDNTVAKPGAEGLPGQAVPNERHGLGSLCPYSVRAITFRVGAVRVLIALGGNAMTGPDGRATPAAQTAAVELAMKGVAALVAQGVEVVLTHGNGPQVGNLLVKNELAAHVVPPVSLDWCDAQTQGTIGFLILNALEKHLAD